MTAWGVYFDSPLSFADGMGIQHEIHKARFAGHIPDTILFLEHRPAVTLGARGRSHHLLIAPEQLAARGIEFARASRGGDVTFHGPGQLIMYPILKLGERKPDSHSYLTNLEEMAIRTATDFGVIARRRKGMNGAWADDGKIAAIGFRLKRWITMHGMSFNVSVDLEGFQMIVPCGLQGESVSSLKKILGDRCPSMDRVRDRMAHHFSQVCSRPLEIFQRSGKLPEPLNQLLRQTR